MLPLGRSSRTYVHSRPVRVLPRPGSSTGTGVSSACSLPRGHHMAAERLHQRRQQPAAITDPVGQGRAIKLDPLSGIDLRLAVQRQVIGVLGHQHVREQSRSGQAARDRPRGCCHLHDALAAGAAELRPHMPHHLEVLRHVLQDFADILTDPAQRACRNPDTRTPAGAPLVRGANARATAGVPASRCVVVDAASVVTTCACACAVCSSSSRSSSWSISRVSFSEERPNCSRRNFAITSFRCSISIVFDASAARCSSTRRWSASTSVGSGGNGLGTYAV